MPGESPVGRPGVDEGRADHDATAPLSRSTCRSCAKRPSSRELGAGTTLTAAICAVLLSVSVAAAGRFSAAPVCTFMHVAPARDPVRD